MRALSCPQKPCLLAGFLRLGVLALCAIALLLTAQPAFARNCQSPKVIRVIDGDTVTLRCRDGAAFKLRLASIDAPERGQPYGRKSTNALKSILRGHPLRVETKAKDRYGRTLGELYVDGHSASMLLVERGLAWCGMRPGRVCRTAQRHAKAQRRGLWRDAEPIPPWQWRKAHPYKKYQPKKKAKK